MTSRVVGICKSRKFALRATYLGYVSFWRSQRSMSLLPDPAMASRQQHEKRLYRLEFKVPTFEFKVDFLSGN